MQTNDVSVNYLTVNMLSLWRQAIPENSVDINAIIPARKGVKYQSTVKSLYNLHLSRQWNCWSLRWRCSIYIFIIDLTPGFNWLGKGNCKTRGETFRFRHLLLVLEVWRQSSRCLKAVKEVPDPDTCPLCLLCLWKGRHIKKQPFISRCLHFGNNQN